MMIEYVNSFEMFAIGASVFISRARLLPFSLLVSSFLMMILFSYHQSELDYLSSVIVSYSEFNSRLARMYFTESVVIMALGVCLSFLKGSLPKCAAILFYVRAMISSLCAMYVENGELLLVQYYAQYFFVILIVLIAWTCAIHSRMVFK